MAVRITEIRQLMINLAKCVAIRVAALRLSIEIDRRAEYWGIPWKSREKVL